MKKTILRLLLACNVAMLLFWVIIFLFFWGESYTAHSIASFFFINIVFIANSIIFVNLLRKLK